MDWEEKFDNQRRALNEKANGHVWKRSEDGLPDTFAYSADYCNGPECILCGFYFCEHCKHNQELPPCPGMTEDCQEKMYVVCGPAFVDAVRAAVSEWDNSGSVSAESIAALRQVLNDVQGSA